MNKVIVYIHGQGGNAKEADHYKALFRGCDVMGLDYTAQTPWEARGEFPALLEPICKKYPSVQIVANSIGAYFAMDALADWPVERAWFISPVVNMEQLITDMMAWAGVTEEELREKGEISTAFGQTLSWDYLCHAREHPVRWEIPTHILYGEKDTLTSYSTISAFAEQTAAFRVKYLDKRAAVHRLPFSFRLYFLAVSIREGQIVSAFVAQTHSGTLSDGKRTESAGGVLFHCIRCIRELFFTIPNQELEPWV